MEDDNPFVKAQTVDPEVRAYVYSLVNALGGSSADDDGRYLLGDDALACLRDLKRWLKLYDEKLNRLDVARCLAEAKLVTGDLLPILASWREDAKEDKVKARVALASLELLVPLTWPLDNPGEMTVNHHRHTPYIQQAQVLYKAGILSWDTCSILRQVIRIGLPAIAMPRDQRTNRDEGIIKLMLYFLRNVTVLRQVPNLPTQGLEMEVSRSATIEAFDRQDVFALLLTISSNMGDEFNLQDIIVLEILFNLVKGVDVSKLWMTEQQRKGADISELRATMTAEKNLQREAQRHAPSRHGRFGTMIWVKREDEKMSAVSGQDNLKDGQTALFNMDKNKKWKKPQQRLKDRDHTIHDFNRFEHLTPSSTGKLRTFVEEFLESGFNPLFTNLRKAIEREAERILDVNYRQFFYTVSWFLEAERFRKEKQKKDALSQKGSAESNVETYSLVAAVLNQETFITLNRYMQTCFDNKEWQDLNASMRCFTQILLTVQEMAQSPLEEDQEIADNIQNRIFYEETTHDRIIAILKGYKDQGFGYLDACTELSHVFLRMLERYSKENVDLQIKSRRRAKQKKKKAASAEGVKPDENAEDDNEQSENEDVVDAIQVAKERKFDFTRFSGKFTSQASVNTYTAFLAFYRDLTTDQLKRAHRFFYRVAFKQDLAVLLYRVDIVALLYRLIEGPEGLGKDHSMFREWSEFSKQLFKKMLKKLEQRPELVVEMLFSKINATLYYLEHGYEKQTSLTAKAPAQLEIRSASGRDLKEQIGIVTTVLVKDGKQNLLVWLKGILQKAFDERVGWEAEAEARKAAFDAETEVSDEPNKVFEIGSPSYITIHAGNGNDEIQMALFRNGRLRLLLKLCGLEILGGEDVLGASWSVPASLKSDQLAASKSAIEEFETTPWQPEQEDEGPEDLIRRSRNVPAQELDNEEEEARRDAFIDDSEGDDNVEDFMFPDNIRKKSNKTKSIIDELKAKRKKRKRDEEDNPEDAAEAEARRKARKVKDDERRSKIKSALYIRDSDEDTDEERDRDFFQQEEALRKRQDATVRRQMALGIDPTAPIKPSTKAKRQRTVTVNDIEDEIMLEGSDDGNDLDETASSQPRQQSQSAEETDQDTPLSSQSSGGIDNADSDRQQLKELRQPRNLLAKRGKQSAVDEPLEQVDVEDDEIVSTARRRFRGGFVIDSDDE